MRIRTVKPEWLTDEKLASLSDEARLMSVALILLADDYGNGRGNTRLLANQVWGYHDPRESIATVSRVSRELLSIGYVFFYEVAQERYYHVVNWERHQKVDKPGKPHVPGPNSRESRESPATVSRLTPTPTSTPTSTNEQGQKKSESVERVWVLYTHLRAVRWPKLRALKFSPKRRSHIAARIREFGVDRILSAVTKFCDLSFFWGNTGAAKEPDLLFRSTEQFEKVEAADPYRSRDSPASSSATLPVPQETPIHSPLPGDDA